ncbi:MAG TPA: hypothetical protein VMY37_16750 [Thermoguttaceae bacterium]|nr:hypothetical protein [Thermoguttaceae bacterium]
MKTRLLTAVILCACLRTIVRGSEAEITVLRVDGQVGEGRQTGGGGFIKPGPWPDSRNFGRFKSWPGANADFRLGDGIFTRLDDLSYIYLGKLASSLTTHKAEWTMGVYYGTVLLSVENVKHDEFFRVQTSVVRAVGRDFDAVIVADRIEPTKVFLLRGEATLYHRHFSDAAAVVLKAGQYATVGLDLSEVKVQEPPNVELLSLRARMQSFKESVPKTSNDSR